MCLVPRDQRHEAPGNVGLPTIHTIRLQKFMQDPQEL